MALCLTSTFAFANSEETLPNVPMADLVWQVRPNLAFTADDIIKSAGLIRVYSDCDDNGNFIKNSNKFTRLDLALTVDNGNILFVHLINPKNATLGKGLAQRFRQAKLNPNLHSIKKYQAKITVGIDPNGVELIPTAKCRAILDEINRNKDRI